LFAENPAAERWGSPDFWNAARDLSKLEDYKAQQAAIQQQFQSLYRAAQEEAGTALEKAEAVQARAAAAARSLGHSGSCK